MHIFVVVFLNHDFVALHWMWKISERLMCLNTSGSYTHVEILTRNSLEKFINYKVLLSATSVGYWSEQCTGIAQV